MQIWTLELLPEGAWNGERETVGHYAYEYLAWNAVNDMIAEEAIAEPEMDDDGTLIWGPDFVIEEHELVTV